MLDCWLLIIVLLIIDYRLLMVFDCWWLIIDGWWLIVDCWLLMVDDWLLIIDYWRLIVDCGSFIIDGWWLIIDGWLLMMDCWWLLMVDYWWLIVLLSCCLISNRNFKVIFNQFPKKVRQSQALNALWMVDYYLSIVLTCT